MHPHVHHRIVWSEHLHRDYEWLASCARLRALLDYTILTARTAQPMLTSEVAELPGAVYPHEAWAGGFDDAAIRAALAHLHDWLPGGLDLDPDDRPTALRVSPFVFDAAARALGWSTGFRCTPDLARVARARGLEVQRVLGEFEVACIETLVAGHADAGVVMREATYIALRDGDRVGVPNVQPVGRIGAGSAPTLALVRAHRRLFRGGSYPLTASLSDDLEVA